jgi:hypothetical protein
MAERPHALSMFLCDQVTFEQQTNKPTLIGIFTRLSCDGFPSAPKHLDVFVALTNGHGTVVLDLQVIRLNTEDQINGQSVEVTFPDPLKVLNLRFRFRLLSFPEPGDYLFQLNCVQEIICYRRVHVYAREDVP